MQFLLEIMCNKVDCCLKDSPKSAGQIEVCSDLKVMQSVLNGGNYKYNFWGRYVSYDSSALFVLESFPTSLVNR